MSRSAAAGRARRSQALRYVLLSIFGLFLVPDLGHAQDVERFYSGRQLKMVIGGAIGGGYDFYGRLLAQFLGKHLPGRPGFVIASMPGAGGIVAANYLYNIAAKDGAEIGIVGRAISTEPLINPGASGPKYIATKFNWIGTPTQEVGLLLARLPNPVRSLADLKAHRLVLAGTAASAPPTLYPRLMNALFRTKFEVISGYEGSQAALLAMERGEVDGHLASSAGAPIRNKLEPWMAAGKITLLAQIGLQRDPRNGDAPMITELAETPTEKKVMQLVLAQQTMAWPFLAPPGVPGERVDALRRAFDLTMVDPEFLARAREQQLEIDPVDGARLNSLLDEIYSAPRDVVDLIARSINP